jgi:hypothetical protein
MRLHYHSADRLGLHHLMLGFETMLALTLFFVLAHAATLL